MEYFQKTGVYRFDILPDKYRSTYLDSAFPYERLMIEDVIIDLSKKTVDSRVSVEIGKDIFKTGYLWPANTAYRAAVQLSLGYFGVLLGETKEEMGEVLQTEFHSYSRRPLYGKNDKIFHVRFDDILARGEIVVGKMIYEIEDSSFSGEVRFVGFRRKVNREQSVHDLSRLENFAINFFTPADALYNRWIKGMLGLRSMYDHAIKKDGAKTFREIYRSISDAKKRKTSKLICLFKKNDGELPIRYLELCNRSICGMLRMYVAKNH